MRHSTSRTSLLAAVVIALVGSGGGAGAAAAAAPTKARARAVAKAINLVAADLPGFTAAPAAPTTAADKRLGARVAHCAGAAGPAREIVNSDSKDFSVMSAGGIAEADASSNVTVLPSARLVAKDLRSIKSKRGRRCVTAAINGLLRGMKIKGVKFGTAKVTVGHPQAPGADGSFALRFKITATIKGVRIPFYVDVVGFIVGRVEVALNTLGILNPFPAADEAGLFTLLLNRAVANRL